MTNSTDAKAQAPAPAPKRRGPFRTEAILPALVLLALVYGYFYFFFDRHLRAGLEFAATHLYGAEVNIADLRTSVWRASFELDGLELTDKQQPARNLFSVGAIRLRLLPDALLRMKLVVEDASTLDIRAYSPRTRPGYVVPPPPPSDQPGLLARAQAQVIAQTRQKFHDNFLGDLAEVLGGVNPREQLNRIKGELQAVARAEGLEKELKEKKAAWEERLRALPKPKDVKELEARVKALDFKGNPLQIAQSVKKARDLIEEAKAKIKLVDDTQQNLSADLKLYSDSLGQLPALAEQDVRDLQKRLQLPGLDAKEFSTQLFLAQLESRLVSLRRYIEIARRYLPPKKTKEQLAAEQKEALVPPKRGEGRTYTFPVTTGYPLFWLKQARISSELNQSKLAGTVKGELRNLTTDPASLGRPLTLQVLGDFPAQGINGFHFAATVDHTTERAKEEVFVRVASFPITELLLADSPAARFGLKRATGATMLKASLADRALTVAMNSSFEKPEFLLETSNARLKEILGGALQGMPAVSLGAKVGGTWENFEFDLDSNLGKELSAGFQRQLEAKLGDAKAQLRSYVQEKLAAPRARLEEQLKALTQGPAKLLGENKAAMEQALKGAEGSAQAAPNGKKSLLKGFGL